MGLLAPESGLLIWMTLAFLVVFFILAKIGFPIILNSMQKRKDYIDSSLDAAKEAEKQLVSLKGDSEAIVAAAQSERVSILKDASDQQVKMIVEARNEAKKQAAEIISTAKAQALVEKEDMVKAAKSELAMLAVEVAEKILRGSLSDKESRRKLSETLMKEITAE